MTSDLQIDNPQVNVDIDRERAGALGVSAQQIETALYDAYGSRQVSTIYTPNNEYWVMMELLPQYQQDMSRAQHAVRALRRTGALVPLSAVATLTQSVGPVAINHSGQLPSVTISFNLRRASRSAKRPQPVQRPRRDVCPSDDHDELLRDGAGVPVDAAGLLAPARPRGLRDLHGARRAVRELHPSDHDSHRACRSPRSARCSTLLLFHIDLDVYGFVGIILLVGIVKKNAIMMIDFAHRGGAERSTRRRRRRSSRRRACASGRS